jgi:predicted nuclease of predicted toxin-antitoxin system
MLHEHSFVADESVDFNLVKFLRIKGLAVFSIMEEVASIKDYLVLKLAADRNAILITEDKDFGELVFKLKLPHTGILLLRIEGMLLEQKNELVFHFIRTFSSELSHNFSVIKQGKLRIRKLQ